MPYQTTHAGLREAATNAIRSSMLAKLDDLNTALVSIVPPLAGSAIATEGQFYIGDADSVPNGANNPFWIAIVGGGRRDGTDSEHELLYIDPGYTNHLYTNIFVYIHPDSFPSEDRFMQANQRELLRARIVDWIRSDCFNNKAGLILHLNSREFAVEPDYDTLDMCFIESVRMGMAQKNFAGTQWVYFAHLHHTARVFGGY